MADSGVRRVVHFTNDGYQVELFTSIMGPATHMLGSYGSPALTLTIYDNYLDVPNLRNSNKVTRPFTPFQVSNNTHRKR